MRGLEPLDGEEVFRRVGFGQEGPLPLRLGPEAEAAFQFRAELRGDRLAALQRLLAEVSTALADEVAATQPDGELHAFGNRRPAPMVSIGCHAS